MTTRAGILEFPCDVERLPNGNTLITDAGDELGNGSEILEVTRAGKIAWRCPAAGSGQAGPDLRFAHSAKRLPSGNTLIADTTNNRVIEVTPAGEVVFNSDDWSGRSGRLSDGSHLHYPNKAKQLPDGTLLITDRNNDRAVIADRDGRVIWQFAGRVKHPHNATILANGNLLICDSDGQFVREVNRAGQVVWTYGDGTKDLLFWPRDADRLPSGNTLITDSKHHRVIEVAPAGQGSEGSQIVWQYQAGHFANFYEADRLPNGNTLIADQQHQEVIEVSPAGQGSEVVWSFRNYTRPVPVNPKLLNCKFTELDAPSPLSLPSPGGSPPFSREPQASGVSRDPEASEVRPREWHVCRRLSEGGGQLVWTTNAAGKRCPGLAYDRDGGVWLQQTREVVPGKTYRVSGLFRTEDLSGMACLQLAFLDEKWGALCDAAESPRSALFNGTTPWSREIFAAVAPPAAVAADVRLFVTGRGKAFVDELFCFG